VTTVCLLPLHTGCGCSGHPAFPTPSFFLGEKFMHDSGASRRGIVESSTSLRANGSRECAPDDRLQRAIQHSEASVMVSKGRGVLDTPHARGMTALCGAAPPASQ